jgi:hypothetical protein
MSAFIVEDFEELNRELEGHKRDRDDVGCQRDTREYGMRCLCYNCEQELEEIDDQIEKVMAEVKMRTDMLDVECSYCGADGKEERGTVGELLYEAGLFGLWDKMQDEKVSKNVHEATVKAAKEIYKRTH